MYILGLLWFLTVSTPATAQERYFKEDHLTGAAYFCMATDGSYTLTAREHMGVWVIESGRWQQEAETITFVPSERSKDRYDATPVSHKTHRFLTFKTDAAPSLVIPADETRRELDKHPGVLPLYVFFEITKAVYVRETAEAYPFRTRRLRVELPPRSDDTTTCGSGK